MMFVHVTSGMFSCNRRHTQVVAAGFSEVDVCVPVRVLRGALIGVEVAAVSSSALVQGGSGMCLQADTALEVLKNVHDFVAVVVPGGNASYCDIVGRDVRLRTILQEFDRRSKLVCGLGTGVLALRNARVLHGRKVAASPEVRSQLAAENLGPVCGAATSFADSMLQPLLGSAGWAGDDVVALRADGHVLTAQGEGTSLDFALSVIEILRNRTAAHAAALLARHPRLETVFTQGHEVVNDCAAAPETLAEQGLLVGVPLGPCGDLTVLPAEPGALPPQEEGGVGVGRDERERKAAVFGPSGARPDVGTQEAVGVVPGMVSAGVTAGKKNGNVSSGHAGREVLDVNIDRIETESAIEYLCKMRAEEQQVLFVRVERFSCPCCCVFACVFLCVHVSFCGAPASEAHIDLLATISSSHRHGESGVCMYTITRNSWQSMKSWKQDDSTAMIQWILMSMPHFLTFPRRLKVRLKGMARIA